MIAHLVRVVQAQFRERKKGRDRSPRWNDVRDAFLKAQGGVCAACGQKKWGQVHHVSPFHLHPELELEPTNLIVLCMGTHECHLRIGHGDDFKAYNPHVRALAERYREAHATERRVIVQEARVGRVLT